MKKTILFFGMVMVISTILAQEKQLEVLIQGMPDGRPVYLSSYYKSEYTRIDSTTAQNESLYFLTDRSTPGMFRLEFPRYRRLQDGRIADGYIEFIWGSESFQLIADYADLSGTVTFGDSKENELLGQFRKYEELYEGKMSAIYPLIERYPEKDKFMETTYNYFIRLQEERDSTILSLSGRDEDLLASSIIRSYRAPVISPMLESEKRAEFLRTHFFDLAPINEPALLYAPVYNSKVIEYLKLYRNQSYSFGEQEQAFMEAVDVIMANVSGDPELRSYIVEYLLDGFKSFGMEQIQTYIVDTYVDETCETDALTLASERVEGYRKMAVGQTGSDIFIRSSTSEMVRLSDVDAEYVVLVFWATYCEHCQEFMPKLKEWYQTDRPDNVEVFAVSIDTVYSDWTRYIQQVNPPWIGAHEPMGWEGKSAEDYNVYATPTIFLLDRHRKIIAKPYTLRELKKEIGKVERKFE